MKIISLSSFDTKGGAARASYRLHQGLNKISVDSWILSQIKYSQDPKVIGAKSASGIEQAKTGLRLTLDQLPLKRYSNREKQRFSPNWLPYQIMPQIAAIDPDLINLHWIGAGYIPIEALAKFKRPIVWTLHDMWAFTGGCHYNQSCEKYTASCGACPLLGSDRETDLSRKVWQRKQQAWRDLDLTVVTPSQWLADCARSSSLFGNQRIEVIPYGLDLDTYRPIDRQTARDLLKLPRDKQLVLFLSLNATSDKRKGFHLLQPALAKLSHNGWQSKLELMVVGASEPENPPELGFKTHYLGTLNDDLTLALAYSAADVFVAPSLQDNLPNTVLEAIACGTPCVAFDIGGMPDMVEDRVNGYLAKPYEIDDLVRGISWILEDEARTQTLSRQAREKAEREFALLIQARRYEAIYREILAKTSIRRSELNKS